MIQQPVIQQSGFRGMLLNWAKWVTAVTVAVFLAAAPFNVRGAPAKSKTKPSAAKGAAKDTDKEEATSDNKEAETKEAAAEPAEGAVKLPEQIYSTGYNDSYVELIKFINTQVRQGWIDNGIRPSEVADDAEW